MKRFIAMFAFMLVIFAGCSTETIVTETMQEQNDTIDATTEKYESGEYSIDNPYTVIDPFAMNQLSGYIAIPIDGKASYEYTVTGKTEDADFTITSDVMQKNNLVVPVVGLYADYDNEVNLTINYKNGDSETTTVKMTTEALDSEEWFQFYETLDMDIKDQDAAVDAFDNGLLMTSKNNAYDINGDLRVALGKYEVGYQNSIYISENNTILQTYSGKIYETDLNGRIYSEYYVPEGYVTHHASLDASNGYTYALISPEVSLEESEETDTYNEGAIAVYKTGQSGDAVFTRDISEDFVGNKVNAAGTSHENGTDLMHLNSIYYDENTDTIIVSSQTQSTIIGLDPETLEVKWNTGDDEIGDAQEDTKLTQLDGHIQSNGQHDATVTENPKYDDGDDSTIEITLFDNLYCVDADGGNRYAELNGDLKLDCPGNDALDTSKLLVYRIDPKEMTVETIDEIEIDGLYSRTQSGWYESPDFAYNIVAYTLLGQTHIFDDEWNEVLVASTDKTLNPYDISAYRMDIWNNEELTNILDNSVESL